MAAGEQGYGVGAEDGVSRIEHDVGEFCEVGGRGEKSGLGSNAAEDAGVFVKDFALDDSLAERLIIDGRRDLRADFYWWIEGCVGHG